MTTVREQYRHGKLDTVVKDPVKVVRAWSGQGGLKNLTELYFVVPPGTGGTVPASGPPKEAWRNLAGGCYTQTGSGAKRRENLSRCSIEITANLYIGLDSMASKHIKELC